MSRNPASSPRRASSPAQGSTGAGILKKIATAIGAVLVALVIAAIALFWFIGDHTDFGRERVVWKAQACGVGLVLVAGLLIACAFAYLGVWRAKRDVDIEKYNQRSFGIVVLCITAFNRQCGRHRIARRSHRCSLRGLRSALRVRLHDHGGLPPHVVYRRGAHRLRLPPPAARHCAIGVRPSPSRPLVCEPRLVVSVPGDAGLPATVVLDQRGRETTRETGRLTPG